MFFDLPPDPPKFWLPPKPAIIRHATPDDLKREVKAFNRRRRGAGGAAATCTYVTNFGNSSDVASHNYGVQSLGAVASDRDIILAISMLPGAAADRQVASATVDGVSLSALMVYKRSNNIGALEFWGGRVATANTTGNVTVTWNAVINNTRTALFRCTGVESLTPVSTDTEETNAVTVTGTAPGGGFAIGIAGNNTGGTVTWTGDLPEVAELNVDSCTTSWAMAAFAATQAITATATRSSSSSPNTILAAWR